MNIINFLLNTYWHLVFQANYSLLFPLDTLMFYGISIGSLLFLFLAISTCLKLYKKLRQDGWNKSAYALIPVIIITDFIAAVFVFGIFSIPLIALMLQWSLCNFNVVMCWFTNDHVSKKIFNLFLMGLLSYLTIFPSLEHLIDFSFGTGLGLVIVLIVFAVGYICDLEVKLQKADANRLTLQDLKKSATEFKNIVQASLDEQKECAICLADFQETEKVNQLPCHHIFHKDCLHPWVKERMEGYEESTCPTCRKPLP
jgi:predicted membrane channel-forming protein YqfA (hemolysin III family)